MPVAVKNSKLTNLFFMMKIISPVVMLFMFFSTALAQVNTEHLSFKGVPIDGKLVDYVSKMKQSGFTHLQTEDGTAYLNGDFAGYKDCYVGVSTLKQKDLVYKIAVVFSEKDTWSVLSTNYFDLKQMLTEKYGEPSDVVEKFDVECTFEQQFCALYGLSPVLCVCKTDPPDKINLEVVRQNC
jgi:hypothetical protein